MKLLTEYLSTKKLDFEFPHHPFKKNVEFFLKNCGFEKIESGHDKPYDENSIGAKKLVKLAEKNPKKRYIIGPDDNYTYVLFVDNEEVSEHNPIFSCKLSTNGDIMPERRGKGTFYGTLEKTNPFTLNMISFKAFYDYNDFRDEVIKHFGWR